MSAVLYSTLNQITGELLFDQLSDYHNSDHFDLLWDSTWKAAFPSDDPVETTDFFLVVNSAIPDEIHPRDPVLLSVNFAAHFGALSWAASHLIALSRLPGEYRCGIVIVDPSPPSSGPAKLLQRMFRGCVSDGGGGIPNVIHLVDPRLEDILAAIADLRKEPPVVDEGQCKLLAALLHSSIVAERVDHHAIGNVLGSILLKNESGGWGQFLEEGKATGAKTPKYQDESMPLQYPVTTLTKCIWNHSVGSGKSKFKDAPFGSERLTGEVLLIDDMADIWKPVLDQALPNAEVSAVLRDEFPAFIVGLPARLDSILSKGEKVTPRALTGSEEDSDSADFILFLDLRLLPEEDPGRAKFYKDLAEIAMSLHQNSEVLPWLGSTDERSEWIGWLAAIQNGKESHPEPLLAQIISLLDPTLPTIIFSSSHASDFADPMAHFGNLSTGFRKPTPAAMPELRMPILKKEFAQACERAARVKHIRHLLAEGFVPRIEYLPAMCEHCEIFVDEGGSYVDDRMNISGIAVCGKADAVEAFHEDLHNRFLAAKSPGATCFHQAVTGSSSTNRPGNYFPKRAETTEEWADHWHNVQVLAKEAQECAEANGVNLLAFALEFPTDGDGAGNWMRLGDLDQESRLLDIGFTATMVKVLEILIFDLFQPNHKNREQNLSLGVDLASRDAVAEHLVQQDIELKRVLREHWGVATVSRRDSKKLKLATTRKSIDDRTPLRLIELAIAGELRGTGSISQLEVIRARACMMKNWEVDDTKANWEGDELMPKPIHYLADFLANAVKNRKFQETAVFLNGEELCGWFDQGFKILETDDSRDWLEILSDWDSGQRVLAIQRVIAAGEEQRSSAPALVRSKIGSWNMDALSDRDLRTLFSDIALTLS